MLVDERSTGTRTRQNGLRSCAEGGFLETTDFRQEIRGFVSPGEFERFKRYLERQVAAGAALEVDCDPAYGHGEIYGGRWFRDLESGEVWRLVAPDPPFTGVWERVQPC